MKKVSPRAATVKGVDVSHHQKTQDWKALKKAGVQFMFAKATEGISYIDPAYKAHLSGAKAAGLLCGAYHFFHPKQDPIAQAEHFVKVAGVVELGYVIDWERPDGLTAQDNRKSGRKFIERVAELTLTTPIIYAGAYTLRDIEMKDDFKKYPLWIANYKTSAPMVPPPWDTWTFWQHSEDGGLDKNYFNGNITELLQFEASIKQAKEIK